MPELNAAGEIINLRAATAGVCTYHNAVLTHMNNEYCLRIAVIDGEFPWHSHPDSDELFVVLEGCLTIECGNCVVELKPGEALLVKAGEKHRTRSASRTVNLCFEKSAATTELCPDPRR
jgi:mannose-6-phosphate isomerase-like protein (cupin superfamily)